MSYITCFLCAMYLLAGSGLAQRTDPEIGEGTFSADSASSTQERVEDIFILHIHAAGWGEYAADIGYDGPGGEVRDSIRAATDEVLFRGSLSEPQIVSVKLRHDTSSMEFEVFLDNGEEATVTIGGSGGGFSVEGSRAHHDYDEYRNSLSPMQTAMDRVDSLYGAALKSGDRSMRDSLKSIARRLSAAKQKRTAEFVTSHPSSAVGVYTLVTTFYHEFDPSLLEDALHAVDGRYKELNDWKYLRDEILAPARATAVGRPAPVIDMTDAAGGRLRLEEYSGKYVLIDFWASWCVPCRAENRELSGVYAKYGHSKFEIVGISLDAERGDWQKASEEDSVPWMNYFDGKAFGNAAARSYGIKAIPASFLVNPEGIIVLRYPDHRELEGYLDSAIR